MTAQAWMIWPENPALSFVILAVLGMVFLYAARRPVHQLLYAVGALISGPLRMGGRWLAATAIAMRQRNKAVLLAHGAPGGRQPHRARVRAHRGAWCSATCRAIRRCSAS